MITTRVVIALRVGCSHHHRVTVVESSQHEDASICQIILVVIVDCGWLMLLLS
jgi:hypothetical protein